MFLSPLADKPAPAELFIEVEQCAPTTQACQSAPGNDAPIGGLKVITASGWFAARPAGTENLHKIYAESFKGLIVNEARHGQQRVGQRARLNRHHFLPVRHWEGGT